MNIEAIYNNNLDVPILAINKANIVQWIDDLYKTIFGIGENNCSRIGLNNNLHSSQYQLQSILHAVIDDKDSIYEIATLFYNNIHVIHEMLLQDLDAIYIFDPAAKHKSEIIFSYPGFYAIAIYRISHQLWLQGIPIIPRIISEYVHNKTGIDIHPGAHIGTRFFIDHGTGIVIGETAIIGDEVKIYQGVTLGALSVRKEDADSKRHPTIENNVTIYANATILGGNTTIGHDSVIGGNVWISGSIPSHSLVFNKSEIIIKQNKTFPEPLNYII